MMIHYEDILRHQTETWADMAWEACGMAIKRHSRVSIWQFLRKSNTELPYDPAILLWGICPQEKGKWDSNGHCMQISIVA